MFMIVGLCGCVNKKAGVCGSCFVWWIKLCFLGGYAVFFTF